MCSIIGSVFVVLGLHAVLWGKSKDQIVPKSTTLEEPQTENELPTTKPPPSTMDAKTQQQPGPSSLFTDIEAMSPQQKSMSAKAMSPQQKPISANEPQTNTTTETEK